ncbi:hypothetical protein Ga0074812_121127 [Parafrankia irregularis]|uniref:Asp23 family, cell envelope-related function n=1 Tax=Parafrankia irregularis TaxID=795642 RepID=A0A0S4QUI6_9ACTN|nr:MULTISPECIES: hypothetical protein [Parafrankia]MBE3205029.1 hypothetical protein [Parafrankia sp. CH37]CUU58750.1 hypothetical protein Ga0074812_121127 [Parafrankia irregularis]
MTTATATTAAIATTGAVAGARARPTPGAGRGWSTDRRAVERRAVERQVRACPDVIRLAGNPAEAVRVLPDAVVVAVVCRYGPTMTELANQVRSAVLIAAPEIPRVDVMITDLDVDLPGWPSPAPGAPVTRGAPLEARRVEGFTHAGSGS